MRRIVLVFVFGALAASACGGGTDEPNGSGEPAGDGEDVVAIMPAAGGFGGRLQEQAQFSVVLFVLDDAEAVDLVGVACAPGGTFTSGVVTVAEAVPLTEGAFTAESPDVRIEGLFVSPIRAEGTIEALTQNAMDCGIGESASWVAECDLSVQRVVPDPAEEGGGVIGGVTATTENGTAFGMLEVVAENGDRLEAELDDAACAAA